MSVWGYRLRGDEVEARLFEDEIPDGWSDSPTTAKPAKRGRPKKKKVEDGDDK